MKVYRKYLFLIIMALLLIILVFPPWKKEKKILIVVIPNSNKTIELWEKPEFGFPDLSLEYMTWMIVRSNHNSPKRYLIDNQYITYRKISVFLSVDQQVVRIETNGKSEETHMIAEYNIRNESFIARSEKTVRNDKGWELLKEIVIR